MLATLRRRSLAALRKQVEPAEPSALARLLADWQGVATAPATRRGPDALLDVIEQLQGAVLPASILERDVLTARIPGYRPEDFDTLCAAGEVVWVGLGPLGDRDGRLALFLADDLPLLRPPLHEDPTTPSSRPPAGSEGDLHGRIREHLARHGASFFGEIHAAAGEGLGRPVQDALWDLAWAGEVTNDTPEALRAFLAVHAVRAERRRRVSSFRSRRQVPPSVVGRWSLLPVPRRAPSATERMKALVEQLLKRHGVLTRDAVAFEEVPGGFSAVYPVLRALEEAGRIRRGYFVAGLGGLQFADPGALDRLRVLREPDPDSPQAVVLAAADPANPYGAALAWPKQEEARLARAAGLHVVLADGLVAAVLSRGARQVTAVLPGEEPARSRLAGAAARALRLVRGHLPRPWDGRWARDRPRRGPLAPFLAEAGFVRSAPGSGCRAPARAGGRRSPSPKRMSGGRGTGTGRGPLAPSLAEAGFVRSGPGFRLPGAPALVPAAEDPHPDGGDS